MFDPDAARAQSRRELFAARYSRFIRACPQAEDTFARELAEEAFIASRPAFVGRWSYSAQKHCNMVNAVNLGRSFRYAAFEQYGDAVLKPGAFEEILDGIAPLNLPAIQMLDAAYASVGRRISLPKLWARQLGEF